jgi:hypothetical protein
VKSRYSNFDFFCKKSLKNGKTAFLVACDIEKKLIKYQNDRGKKLHPNLLGFTG